MIEIFKETLFYIALGTGSVMLISLLIAGIIKCLCILLDQLKVGKIIKEGIILYIKNKNLNLKVKKVDLKKQGIYKE